ncbi:BRO family protein [Adonisia turfae]|nr:BRO family protein [Adonisia turfae]
MSEISLFTFEGSEIRYVGDDAKYEWVASDVVAALHPTANPTNLSNYLKSVSPKRKGNKIVITPGGEQSVVTLLEGGLYELLGKSRSKTAERFQDWLYDEVLPTIRKTGSYSVAETIDVEAVEVPQLPPAPPITELIDDSEALGRLFGPAYGESFAIINIKKFHPHKALPDVSARERSSMETAEALLNATQIAEELGLTCKTNSNPSPQEANKLLANLGYQYKVGKGKSGQWTPTEKGDDFCDRKPVSTNSKSDKFQLLWRASIVNELRGQSMESTN